MSASYLGVFHFSEGRITSEPSSAKQVNPCTTRLRKRRICFHRTFSPSEKGIGNLLLWPSPKVIRPSLSFLARYWDSSLYSRMTEDKSRASRSSRDMVMTFSCFPSFIIFSLCTARESGGGHNTLYLRPMATTVCGNSWMLVQYHVGGHQPLSFRVHRLGQTFQGVGPQ